VKAGTVNVGGWFMLTNRWSRETGGRAVQLTKAGPPYVDKYVSSSGIHSKTYGETIQHITFHNANGRRTNTYTGCLWRRATDTQIMDARRARLGHRIANAARILRDALNQDGDVLQPGDMEAIVSVLESTPPTP
jgi:hypothetical protein